MREVVSNTGILVLATHSPDMVRRECNRLIQLSHGQKISDEPLGDRAG
jgi:lipopolysaccharide transport system ATP-binding protein